MSVSDLGSARSGGTNASTCYDGPPAGEGLQECIARSLAAARNALASSHDDALQSLSRHMEVHAQMEAELAALHSENHALRERLRTLGLQAESLGFVETGGTGESSVRPWDTAASPRGGSGGGGGSDRVAFLDQQQRPLPLAAQTPRPISGLRRTNSRVSTPGTVGWNLSSSRHRGLAMAPRMSDTASQPPGFRSIGSGLEGASGVIGAGASDGGGAEDSAARTLESEPHLPASPRAQTPSESAPSLGVPGEVISTRSFASTTCLVAPGVRFMEDDLGGENIKNPSTSGHTSDYRVVFTVSEESSDQTPLTGVVPADPSLPNCQSELSLDESGKLSTGFPRRLRSNEMSSEELVSEKAHTIVSTVLPNGEAMRAKVRRSIAQPQYAVENLYRTQGIWQWIARSTRFDNITLAVIGFNAIWIMIDTDNNDADILLESAPVFQVAENSFCCYFALEWLVRFMSFAHKSEGFRDFWFVFDSALVAVTVLETWVFTLFVLASGSGVTGVSPRAGSGINTGLLKLIRLVRLSRLARMARLFRAFPELMIMVKGMAVAMRSVFFTLLLLLCIIYVFAIIFVQLLGPQGALNVSNPNMKEIFPNVLISMHTLLVEGALPDQADFISTVGDEHPVMRVLIMVYILLAGLTVMNMLVGVLCEVISVVSSVEKESLLVNFVKAELMQMVSIGDTNHDKMISKGEFMELLNNSRARKALTNLGVDAVGLFDFADLIFAEPRDLSFTEFMEVILQLRGTNTATVKDIVDLRKLIVIEISKVAEALNIETEKSRIMPTVYMQSEASVLPKVKPTKSFGSGRHA